MDKISQINNLLSRLNSMRPFNQGELKRMLEQFTIRNTYNSNAIEGCTITLRETAMIIQEGITISQRPIKEHLDIIGHKDAFEFVVELSANTQPLTEHDILQIHSLVLMNDRLNAGVYRRLPVQIMDASHVPPQPFIVPDMIRELVNDYAASNDDIFTKIAKFHLDFERIHPFIDGNGRTGRLIMNLELMKHGYLPIDIKYADRMKYYDSFQDYDTTGSIQMLLNMIMDYEEQELAEYIAIAEQAEDGNDFSPEA